MVKTIKEHSGELFIEFTPEELVQLELDLGDVFECSTDGTSITLKRTKKAIDVDLSEFGKVNLFAARAKDLEAGCLQDVAETHWQHLLLVAECSGAEAVNPGQILLVNFSKTAW